MDDTERFTRALVILAAILPTFALIAVECILLPALGWLWILLIIILAGAAGYSLFTIVRILIHGRRR
ncbi:hypothetical protein ACLUWU_00005 [Bifidobacterium thermophilum]|uniref:hypothetical protein n=1 Tax=Bifidobacterium thermophilum TaxID=33905 RepID=UPI003993E541